ncbi:hypothetical protein [Salsipaludibacter albus]|uniref:hypothetical protein n=1 Tax=Salsipaludibacter albus TaxID=2849650 RepID=UPI001EE46480|nr:hypothetical protein [Salsipaludibacter albus]MBY5163923.1 hypothetical protein [Salsipaludibacter albus]
MECRLDLLEFDVAGTAGWYSSIVGVLAGFALLAILIPLDHEAARDDERSADTVVIMTCAFFSLLLLSFSYAILAGRVGDTERGQAVHEQLLLGVAVGLSSLLLMFALNTLLATYGANRRAFLPARRIIVVATSLIGPAVVIAVQFSNALDIERVRIGSDPTVACGLGGLPNGVWINLAITTAGLIAVVVTALLRRRIPRNSRAASRIAVAVLLYTTLVVVWTSIGAPLLPPEVLTNAVFEHVALAITALAAVGVAITSWSGR